MLVANEHKISNGCWFQLLLFLFQLVVVGCCCFFKMARFVRAQRSRSHKMKTCSSIAIKFWANEHLTDWQVHIIYTLSTRKEETKISTNPMKTHCFYIGHILCLCLPHEISNGEHFECSLKYIKWCNFSRKDEHNNNKNITANLFNGNTETAQHINTRPYYCIWFHN